MKTPVLLILLFFVFSPFAKAQDGEEVTLFNGKDLSNWEGDMSLWRVEDGMIVGEFEEIEHNQFLRSNIEVSDFRLILKVKVIDGQGNSGIQFRSEALPSGEVKGMQADIGDGYWGKLYEEHARGWLWEKGCGEHVNKDGWNTYEIVAVGNKVRTAINGHMCLDYEDPEIAKSGIIALQLHAGFAPPEIYFKDFKLVENPEFKLITVD